jgi:hypothetical protein
VNGRRISLVFLEGDLATTQVQSVPLDVSPVSAPAQAIAVQGHGGNAITISLKSDLSVEEWQTQVLAEEIDDTPDSIDVESNFGGRYVDKVHCDTGQITDPCSGNIVITMETGATYDLRMAKVTIGSVSASPTAAYVTKVGAEKPTILPDGTELAIEVRDEFNNPISGQEVIFELFEGDGDLSTTTTTTDETGRASTVYTPVGNETVTVYAGIDTAAPSGHITDADGAKNIVKYEGLTVGEGQLRDVSDFDINSRAPGTATVNYGVLSSNSCNSGGSCYVTVNFENTHDTKTRTIKQMRVNYYSPGSISRGNGVGAPTLVTVAGEEGTSTLMVQGDYKNVTIDSIDPHEAKDIDFTFMQSDGSDYSSVEGDFFVTTIIYTDGSSNIYFIAPITPDDLDTLNSLRTFGSASATNLDAGRSTETQTFSFTLEGAMAGGETVTINLDAAQNLAGQTPDEVDYRSATVGGSLQGGSATLTTNNNDATITYTAPAGGLTDGTTVTVQLTDVKTGDTTSDLLVVFERSDSLLDSQTTFDVI